MRVRRFLYPEKCNERQRLWTEFFRHYGQTCIGTADGQSCQWGVSDPEALTVGHLLNDRQTRHKGLTGKVLLMQLRKKGWPKDIGVGPQCGSCQIKDHRR